jgi:hypothetical protein
MRLFPLLSLNGVKRHQHFPMHNVAIKSLAADRREPVVLGALLGRRRERSLLVDWRGARPRLEFVDDRLGLLRAVRRMDVRVVVLPLFDQHGVPTAPLVERLKRELPHVGVILLTLQPNGSGIALLSAVRAGGTPLVAPTADALWREIGAHLANEGSSRTRGLALELLDSVALPPLVASLLASAVEHAHRRLTVSTLALGAGFSRRTLARRIHLATPRAGLTPKELILWGRLIRAAVETHANRVAPMRRARWAELAGFHSNTSLRAAMRALIGRVSIDDFPLAPDVVALFCERLSAAK